MCPKHRAKSSRDQVNQPAEAKKIIKKRYRQSPLGRSTEALYQHTETRVEWVNQNARNVKARPERKVVQSMRDAIRDILKNENHPRIGSCLFKLGDFLNAAEVRAHFRASWTGAMSWDNYGKGASKWDQGHLIAQKYYDTANEEDVRRLMHRDNMKAQWSIENTTMQTELPPIEVLEQLAHVYPVGWGGVPRR